MKNLLSALLILFVTVHLSAEDISLRHPDNYRLNRFYVGLVGKTAALNGDWGLFGGMKAGYNINENVSIGFSGHGLIPVKLGSSYINIKGRDELHFGYGGIEGSYKLNISERFFLTGVLMAGAGRADYEIADGYDYFFIAEPGASVNLRLTDWFGLGYTVSYRAASGVKYADFSNASFSGWTMDLAFNFGF